MKNVLLTTTALVAFAGAAAADVSWSGAAEIGYNDEYVDGVYFDADIDVAASAALDNGYTASASYGVDISTGTLAGDDFPELSISNGMNSLSLGAVGVASDHYSNITGMLDGVADATDAQVLRADAAFGDFSASASFVVNATDFADFADATVADDDTSFGVSGTFGSVSFGAGFDSEENNFGVNAGFDLGAAAISVAYSDTDGVASTGVGVGYDLGNGMTVGATYAQNDGETDDTYGVTGSYTDAGLTVSAAYLSDDGNGELSGEVSYDMGNGFVVMAGFSDQDNGAGTDDNNQWVAATYDLGGGASVLVSYATDDAPEVLGAGTEEIGANDYYEGITLQVSMAF